MYDRASWLEESQGAQLLQASERIREESMGLILVILLLALVFGGLGFVYPILWIVAAILFIGWIFSFSRSRSHARAA